MRRFRSVCDTLGLTGYLFLSQHLSVQVQVLLACGEGNLVLLEVADRQLEELGSTRLSKDVACVDVTPLQPGESAATLAAVGTWDHAVHLLRIPDLSTVRSEPLGVDVIPRSILFSTLEGVSYLLVALGAASSSQSVRAYDLR